MPNLQNIALGATGWGPIINDDIDLLNQRIGAQLNASDPFGTDTILNNTTTQADPAALTTDTLTDSSGGTPATTIVAISGSGADIDINNNFASFAAQVNKIRSDLSSLRTVAIGIIDYCDSMKGTLNTLLAALRETGGVGILSD